ncbi:MAG: hypothetical protein M3464_16855 [Chloroflexota bacterium]|nr:hypothetical protein [Chloroflexota bacterium]
MVGQLRRFSRREREAVADFKRLLRDRYPDATFEVKLGGEPDGVYLMATIDHENTFDVIAHIRDRLLEVQVDEGLPVYVIPLRADHSIRSSK